MTRIRKDEVLAENQPLTQEQLNNIRAAAPCIASSEYDEQYSVFDQRLNRHIHITVYLNR
jgi:D-hexose-6-phosphate mutarotase